MSLIDHSTLVACKWCVQCPFIELIETPLANRGFWPRGGAVGHPCLGVGQEGQMLQVNQQKRQLMWYKPPGNCFECRQLRHWAKFCQEPQTATRCMPVIGRQSFCVPPKGPPPSPCRWRNQTPSPTPCPSPPLVLPQGGVGDRHMLNPKNFRCSSLCCCGKTTTQECCPKHSSGKL